MVKGRPKVRKVREMAVVRAKVERPEAVQDPKLAVKKETVKEDDLCSREL